VIKRRKALYAFLLPILGLKIGMPLAAAQEAQTGNRPRRKNQEAKSKGRERGGVGEFHRIIEEVMKEHEIAGGTMAIAKDGRLILARGYGLADVEGGRPVTHETLFSLASVTKSVSGVAAMKLVEEGRLHLNARIVDLFHDIKPLPGQTMVDPRFREITVHHLLYHGSGMAHDTVRSGRKDPAVGDDEEETEDVTQVYRSVMGRPLDFAPGSEHRYSNLGFLVLRLAIERAAGQPYEPFVRDHILKPMGITRMVMETREPIPGETKRYVVGPGGRRPAAHIPHNWLATPTDMVKFLTALTGTRGKAFLSERTMTRMLAVPPPPIQPLRDGRHVGLGWDTVRHTEEGYQFSKNGGKVGVMAWLEHLPNGVDWAFMFNTSTGTGAEPKEPNAARETIRRIDEAAQALRVWPKVDLFSRSS